MLERSEMYARAARQHGCLTTAQLAAAGIGRREIARWLADGSVRRRHRGVYVLGPVESPLARYAAALLAVGPGAALSHQAAGALHELLPAPEHIDVTTAARGARQREGVHVRHTASLPQSAVRVLHHLRVTSPERTLIDLANAGHPSLARAVEEAQVRRLVAPDALPAALRTPEPSFTRSEAERRLLALIRAANLPPPRTNVPLGPYVVDFLWPDHRLVVEVDGFAFHSSRAAFERDRARDADLQARGYRVIRITWRQLQREPHAVVARLAAALALAAA
jgi:very-short-patch-repair endonuclease